MILRILQRKDVDGVVLVIQDEGESTETLLRKRGFHDDQIEWSSVNETILSEPTKRHIDVDVAIIADSESCKALTILS